MDGRLASQLAEEDIGATSELVVDIHNIGGTSPSRIVEIGGAEQAGADSKDEAEPPRSRVAAWTREARYLSSSAQRVAHLSLFRFQRGWKGRSLRYQT